MASRAIIRRLKHLSHSNPIMPFTWFSSLQKGTFGSEVGEIKEQQFLYQNPSKNADMMRRPETKPHVEKEVRQACHEHGNIGILAKLEMLNQARVPDGTYLSHLPQIIRTPTGHFISSKKDKARQVCQYCLKSKLRYSHVFPAKDGHSQCDDTFVYEDFVPPPSVDWRKLGVVTPVQDLLISGPCWAFASIASVESINAIMTGELIKLSEQQLIDCINITHGDIKDGGFAENAFCYIMKNGGVVPAESYPYVARQCACKTFEDYMVTIDAYQYVPPDEQSLKKAVANQPVDAKIER